MALLSEVVIDLTEASPDPVSSLGPWLSVIMPAYNEAETLRDAVAGVLGLGVDSGLELVVVDDGSTDDTPLVLSTFCDPRLTVIRHRRNQGKGSAVLSGIAAARGTHAVIFDADLEYDPQDLLGLMAPVMDGGADVVYGVRCLAEGATWPLRFRVGNRVMTGFANLLFASDISDLHTCLKLVRIDHLMKLDLSDAGFGLDSELTAKMLKFGCRPVEVPVSYRPRGRAEGKKIGWRDAVKCLTLLLRIRYGRASGSLSPEPFQLGIQMAAAEAAVSTT